MNKSSQEMIKERTMSAILVAQVSFEEDCHVGAGAKRLAAQATTEYHDRFLIELVQNAHDAHPPMGRDGQIEVLMDHDEGEFGTLYVANRGRTFSESNFKSICQLGLSDKLPGEAIGNKGIGFKSVLQICERPEVYSGRPGVTNAPAHPFDGFCFSFATDQELREILDGDEDAFRIVRQETARFHLPVPLEVLPDRVRDFAQQGFATVVRLPVSRRGAIEEIALELRNLRRVEAPLLLFLDRLSSLGIEEVGGGRQGGRIVLHRDTEDLDWRDIPDGLSLSRIDLGEGGQYLAAAIRIEPERVAEVIHTAVEAREIDETWLEWQEAAIVTAAVRLDEPLEKGNLYTFLPMEVGAPFAGHLNAPFYARLDRRDLNRSLALNELFLDAGATACRLTAQLIATQDRRILAPAGVDFLTWVRAECTRLDCEGERRRPLVEETILPVLAGGGLGWGSLSASYIWDGDARAALTADAVTNATKVSLVDQSLGASRLKRLGELSEQLLGFSMDPSLETVADWCEAIAACRLKRGKLELGWWNSFYDELALVFAGRGKCLERRRILLDEDGRIQAAAGSDGDSVQEGPTVFFQPARERTEGMVDIDVTDDVRIPKSLRRRIAFLHPEIEWLEQIGTTRQKTSARKFFDNSRLVQPYAARALLEHLQEILHTSRSKRVFRDALRLAYRLHKSRDYDKRPALRDLRLRVPCRGGWVEADQAHFSRLWPGTTGESLERLIDLASGSSEEIGDLQDRLLLAPAEWEFTVEPREWIEFLRQAGVRDGLWPITRNVGGVSERGEWFHPRRMYRGSGMPDSVRQYWNEAVSNSAIRPQYPKGQYENLSELYFIPGQADYPSLPAVAREAYAKLLAASCGSWSEEHFAVDFRRADVTSRNVDRFSWPTPLAAFMEQEEWMPVAAPGNRDDVVFRRLREAWHFSPTAVDADGYAQPTYSPLVPINVRHILESRPEGMKRLRRHGLNLWNDPADSVQLIQHLVELVGLQQFGSADAARVRKAYEQCWVAAISQSAGAEAAASPCLLVMCGDRLAVFDTRVEEGGVIHVNDGGSELAENVLRLSSRPLLDVKDDLGRKILELLRAAHGSRIRGMSEVQVVVVDAGAPVEPSDLNDHLISGDLAWLEWLVMAALELKRGAFRQLSENRRQEILRILRAVRLRFASCIRLQIGDEVLRPPRTMEAAVPLADEQFPTVIVRGRGPALNWSELESLIPALADLINYGELASTMQLAVKRLADAEALPVTVPSIPQIAGALQESEEQVHELIRSLRQPGGALLDILAPVLVVWAGLDAYLSLVDGVQEDDDEEAVLSAVASLDIPRSPEELRDLALGVAGGDQLRRSLNIPLGDFNEALQSLGRSPIHYEEVHALAFREFVAERRGEIMDRLRRAYLDDFRQGRSLAVYVEARDPTRILAPDPGWLHEHEVPPAGQMESRVQTWLEEATGGRGPTLEELAALDAVRRLNRKKVMEALDVAQPLVLAWCQWKDRSPAPIWSQDDLGSTVWNRLLAAGQVDFDLIDEEYLLASLSEAHDWPEGMPLCLDMARLGLTKDLVDAAQTEEERERTVRERLRQTIELDGVRVSAVREDFPALAEAARETIDDRFLQTRAGFSELAPLGQASNKSGRSQSSGSPKKQMTDTQRDGIGLVGEVVALEWLKRHYKGANDDAWKSRYRDSVLGGSFGDDSLGFDFEVPSSRTSYFFEVKGTSGEEMKIELGETEVVAARLHARTDRFRILYVTYALDPSRRAIHMLPNPFSDRGRDFFRLEGSGLRYRFRLHANGPG